MADRVVGLGGKNDILTGDDLAHRLHVADLEVNDQKKDGTREGHAVHDAELSDELMGGRQTAHLRLFTIGLEKREPRCAHQTEGHTDERQGPEQHGQGPTDEGDGSTGQDQGTG